MTKWVLSLALVSGLGLATAPPAEASHRHSRSCRHRTYAYAYEDRRPVYRYEPYYDDDYGYAPRYSSNGPSRYDRYYDEYYYAPPPPPRIAVHYHGRLRCTRSHFSLHIGF